MKKSIGVISPFTDEIAQWMDEQYKGRPQEDNIYIIQRMDDVPNRILTDIVYLKSAHLVPEEVRDEAAKRLKEFSEYEITMPGSDKSTIIRAVSIQTEMTGGRTIFFNDDGVWDEGKNIVAIAPVEALIIKTK